MTSKTLKTFNRLKFLHRSQNFEKCISYQTMKTIKDTVIKSQVEVMESIQNEWWDQNGMAKVLHALNKRRVPFLKNSVLKMAGPNYESKDESESLKGFRILDVGCGGGILSEALAKLGAKVDGVDASEDLVNVAKNHASKNPVISKNLNYICAKIEDYSEHNKEIYDGVVISEVIEHIEEKDIFLRNCLKTLKTGGSLCFTTFNRTFFAWFYGILLAEKIMKVIPKGTHEYRLFISPEGLTDLLKKYNCETVQVKGLFYRFYNNNWTWTNHRHLSYALQAIKK